MSKAQSEAVVGFVNKVGLLTAVNQPVNTANESGEVAPNKERRTLCRENIQTIHGNIFFSLLITLKNM